MPIPQLLRRVRDWARIEPDDSSGLWPFARGRRRCHERRLSRAMPIACGRRPTPTETAISFLDEELAARSHAAAGGKRLLDAGCGIGRRMAGVEPRWMIGVDASPEMLAAGNDKASPPRMCAHCLSHRRQFDMVWCRLVLGHLSDPRTRLSRIGARLSRADGYLFVTDFHADAVAAGHARSFPRTRRPRCTKSSIMFTVSPDMSPLPNGQGFRSSAKGTALSEKP